MLPINIPISTSCKNLLNGLLEKNPEFRIDLSSHLINDWLEDETKLKYKHKHKPDSNLKIQEIKEKIEKELETLKLETIISTTNIIELKDLDNSNHEEEILKEPAKFEQDADKPHSRNAKPAISKLGSSSNTSSKHQTLSKPTSKKNSIKSSSFSLKLEEKISSPMSKFKKKI